MSIGYAGLGIGWIRPFWFSRGLEYQRRTTSWVIGGFTADFVIAISSVGFLVAGSELERLQILFLEVREPYFSERM